VTIVDDGPEPWAFTPFTLMVTELPGMLTGKFMLTVLDVALPTIDAPPVTTQLYEVAPVIVGTLYETVVPDVPMQGLVFPEIAPAARGNPACTTVIGKEAAP
jgi:hypothetical protein